MISPTILCRFSDRAEEARRRARAIKRELGKTGSNVDFNRVIEDAEWLADWLLLEPNGSSS